MKALKSSLKSVAPISNQIITETTDQNDTFPTHPPVAPPTNTIMNKFDISSLKPPPPPPQTSSNTSPGSNRLHVINELKDMFKKRKLVMG